MAEAQEPVASPVPLDAEAQARVVATIRERIASGRAELPPLPSIALEVSQLARGEDVDVAKVTSVANRDPALAGQILRVANSPLWSPREPIVSLQQAVARMGAAAVANVAFLVAAKGAGFQAGLKPEEAAAEWRHALLTGCFAKEIARMRRAGVESAFLCGLLHDIGRPIFLREWATAAPAGAPPPPLGDGEDVQLHVEAGVALVRAWGLPETFVDAVGGHHADDFAGRDGAATVNLADRMALAALSDGFAAKQFVGDQAALALNLYPDDVAAVWDRRERLMQTAAALR